MQKALTMANVQQQDARLIANRRGYRLGQIGRF
jgi:hypothetical protein